MTVRGELVASGEETAAARAELAAVKSELVAVKFEAASVVSANQQHTGQLRELSKRVEESLVKAGSAGGATNREEIDEALAAMGQDLSDVRKGYQLCEHNISELRSAQLSAAQLLKSAAMAAESDRSELRELEERVSSWDAQRSKLHGQQVAHAKAIRSCRAQLSPLRAARVKEQQSGSPRSPRKVSSRANSEEPRADHEDLSSDHEDLGKSRARSSTLDSAQYLASDNHYLLAALSEQHSRLDSKVRELERQLSVQSELQVNPESSPQLRSEMQGLENRLTGIWEQQRSRLEARVDVHSEQWSQQWNSWEQQWSKLESRFDGAIGAVSSRLQASEVATAACRSSMEEAWRESWDRVEERVSGCARELEEMKGKCEELAGVEECIKSLKEESVGWMTLENQREREHQAIHQAIQESISAHEEEVMHHEGYIKKVKSA